MPSRILVPVRAQPRASRNEIADVVDGYVRVRTTAPPSDGRANKAIARQLAEAFRVPRSRVSLKSGANSRFKRFVVEDPNHIPDWYQDPDFS